MSPDETRPGDAPEEHPEDRVARLLGQVGAERPEAPPEVQARLDATLADLVRERHAADGPAPGGAHRPRRRFLLAAAAAVIVLGAGGATVAALTGQSGQTTASKAGGAAADSQEPGAPEASLPLRGKASDGADAAQAGGLPLVRPGHVAADLRALQRDLRAPRSTKRLPPVPVDCTAPPGVPPQRVRTVLYGHTPASLVLRPSADAPRVAEVWSCSGKNRLVRVEIPAP
jgi:hypothetical protein